MSRARRPTEVAYDLSLIAAMLEPLLVDYDHAYDFAHSLGRGDSVRSGAVVDVDPTGETALSRSAALSSLAKTDRLIQTMTNSGRMAESALANVYGLKRPDYEPVARLRKWQITEVERIALIDAQVRRRGRGEL